MISVVQQFIFKSQGMRTETADLSLDDHLLISHTNDFGAGQKTNSLTLLFQYFWIGLDIIYLSMSLR